MEIQPSGTLFPIRLNGILKPNVFGKVLENMRTPEMKKPFGMMIKGLDEMKKDEVHICTGSCYLYEI